MQCWLVDIYSTSVNLPFYEIHENDMYHSMRTTTGPNLARMISAKSIPVDFGLILVSLCRKNFRFRHQYLTQEQIISLES